MYFHEQPIHQDGEFAATYLQISIPQLELSRQSLFVSLDGRVVNLFLWQKPAEEQRVRFGFLTHKTESLGSSSAKCTHDVAVSQVHFWQQRQKMIT